MRRLSKVYAILGLSAALVVSSAVVGSCGVLASSTFDSGDEGWRVMGDVQDGSSLPFYSATEGNPGGCVYADDDVLGGVWYWIAPNAFLGDKSAAYGHTLDFDLKQSRTDSQFNSNDIVIVGGGLTLTFDTSYNPATTWTSYSVLLDETSGWKNGSMAASQTDIMTALSSISSLRIRGEYRTGDDRDHLDNVVMHGTVVPEPGSLAVLASGLGACVAGFLRRRK